MDNSIDQSDAIALANHYSQVGEGVAMAAVYADAIALYLCISTDTQKRLEEELTDILLTSGRSEDGFTCCLVLVPEVLDELPHPAYEHPPLKRIQQFVALFLDSEGCGWITDDRTLDHFSLKLFAEHVAVRYGNGGADVRA